MHTPKPWKFDGDLVTFEGEDGEDAICQLFQPYMTEDESENEAFMFANGNLIAAAPDMLEALERLYNAIDSCVDLTPELLKECRKVIKKAKGE